MRPEFTVYIGLRRYMVRGNVHSRQYRARLDAYGRVVILAASAALRHNPNCDHGACNPTVFDRYNTTNHNTTRVVDSLAGNKEILTPLGRGQEQVPVVVVVLKGQVDSLKQCSVGAFANRKYGIPPKRRMTKFDVYSQGLRIGDATRIAPVSPHEAWAKFERT